MFSCVKLHESNFEICWLFRPADCCFHYQTCKAEPEHLVEMMHSYSTKTGNDKSVIDCSLTCSRLFKAPAQIFIHSTPIFPTGIQMDTLKVELGEEIFSMCYEEDGHILRVVGGALHDFLNSFNVLLKQSSVQPNPDGESCINEPSVLCLDKDPGLLTVYFFNPDPTTELFFPGVIKAAARLLYHTTVEVLKDALSTKDSILQSSPQPSLLYTVVVQETKTLSPSPLRANSAGTLPTSLFSTIFPFHLILDQDLFLVQIGHGLRKRLTRKDGQRRSSTFQEHFSIVSPQIKCTFQGILTMLNTQFIIRIKHGVSSTDNTGKVCGQSCEKKTSKSGH